MVAASYNNIRPRKTGPFRITKLKSHTVVIDKDGVSNAVYTHRIAADPMLESNKSTKRPRTAERSSSSQTVGDRPRQQNDRTMKDVACKTDPQVEHAVEQIIGHEGHGRRCRYTVPCYGYAPKEDTLEPARNNSHHFLARYNDREI